jgi:ATP synthase protein I
MNDEPRPQRNPLVVAGRLVAIAWEFVGFIAGGAIAGYLADRWLGTEPWLLIGFTLSGTGAGFYQLLRMLRLFEKHG